MSHEFKFGDWARETASGYIVRFVTKAGDTTWWLFPDGMMGCNREVEYLPDCTGFDWQPPKPIEPPPGYRLMGDDEITGEGDLYLSGRGDWCPTANTLRDGTTASVALNRHGGVKAYARKIEPTYRAFANAEEFKPFRYRWWRYKTCDTIMPPAEYSPSESDWKYRFEAWEFDDGTPFGIKVEERAK